MKKLYLNSERNSAVSLKPSMTIRLLLMVLFVCLFASNTVATAQIAQRGTATFATSTSTTVDVEKPSGILAGDVLIATINQADNDRDELSNATLTGWQLVGGAKFYSSGDNEWWGTVLYKVATASDVIATNFTFTGDSDADDMQASIIAFSGVDQNNPIDVAGTFTSSTDDNTSLTANSITTTSKNAAVIMLAMISDDRDFNDNWNTTSPGGLTDLFDRPFDADLNMGIGGAWAIKPSAGATGNGTVTLSDNARDGAILIALRAAPLPGSSITETFTSGGTFTVPSCVTSLTVEAWGGGGAGGGVTGNVASGGGGKGGSYVKRVDLSVSADQSYTVTVGSGGSGGTGNGGSGGSSSFVNGTLNINVLAAGGAGGNAGSTNASDGAGATATNGTNSGSTSPFSYNGGNGANGSRSNNRGGGGGSSAGTGQNGNNGSNQTGGTAPTGGGAGGNGFTGSGNEGNGSTATQVGGGGGGALTDDTSDYSGGSGANGLVKVTYTLPSKPTITLTNTTATTCSSASAQNVTLAYSATTGCADKYSIDFTSGITDVIDANLSSSPITIAITAGLAAGTYEGTLTVKNSTYGFVSSTYSISVTVSNNTAGAASSSPTLCNNTVLTNITHATTGATGIGTATGLPAGVTAAWASNVITISGTPTNSGTFNYIIPLTGGCGTVNATGTIEVVAAPSAAGTITGTATVCRSQSGVGYSVPAISNATSYNWSYTGTGATITNGTTRTPTIAFAANATSGNLTVYGVNACGNGTISSNYAITINPLPVAAGTITGTATVCQGQSGVGYSVPAITNATSYNWSYTGTGATITNGTTRTPTIAFAANATSGNLTVYGVNACGNGTISSNYAITINPLPVAAGTITGTVTVCRSQSGVGYSVPAITNATSYTWAYTGTGATITNGTTRTPTIAFAANATSGNLTVYGVNACGNGTISSNYAITINPLPVAAGTITGTATVCIGQSGVEYSVPAITNATSYNWSYTGTGATITNSTTRTPTIVFASNATSGNLTVYGANACGNGTISSNYAITVKPLPIATITANYCAVPGKIQLTASGGDTYLWNTGQTSNPIEVDLAGDYSVTASLGGCTSTPFTLNVGQELVTNGDFTAGNTGFTSGYTYKEDIAGNNRELWDDKGNAIGTNGQNYHENFWGIDHTNNPTGPRNFMLVNGYGSTITIWQQTVNVQPNTDYYFSAWAMSLNNLSPYAKLRFEVNGVQVGTTANLGPGPSNATQALANNYWTRFYSDPIWNSGSLNGPITIKIVNLESSPSGNDFALDDISFGTLAALPFSIVVAGNTGTDSTLCTGETFNLFTNLTNGKDPITYSWTGPNGFTSNVANPSILNVTAANSGSYTLTVRDGYSCGSQTKSVNLTVTPFLISPTIGSTTQPTCTKATGSVVLNGLPASGTWNLYQNGNATPIVTGGSGTSTTISDLAVGTYTYTVSIGTCISSSSSSVSINPALTNTWSHSGWDNGTPDKTQKLVFAADYPPTGYTDVDIEGCSCLVTGNKTVKIKSGKTLTITNEVKVVADGSGVGSLIFENNASLVQINNVATNNNTGDIQYYRSTYSRLTDYNYLSSPVSPSKGSLGPQTLGKIATDLLNGTFYSYKPTATGEDWEPESAGTIMVAGKGYIAARISEIPQSSATIPKLELQFSGIPNNGTYEINGLFADKSYLLGNPYPSALDADTFLNANKDVLNGTLYFWTHNTAMKDRVLLSANSAGSGAYAYTADDYATYNATGGVAATNIDLGAETGGALSGIGTNNGAINKQAPSGKIASGQGFFASSKLTIPANSKIVFNNAMRVGVINLANEDNTQFFKTRDPKTKASSTTTIEKNRVWLNMSNTEGAFKQTLVGYLTEATNDYDDRFDGESYDANEYVDFYSLNQDLNLTIQGRALPFNENDEVPLGYRTTITGDFTINIAQVDGVLTNQAVFIEDKLTNKVTDLKTGNYTFSTAPGTFNDRFVLKYMDASKTLAVDTIEKEDGILAFYSSNYNTLIIHNDNYDTMVNSVALFNMAGQKIGVWDVSNSEQKNIQVPIKSISSGIYIVKVSTTKGESSKKIIVN